MEWKIGDYVLCINPGTTPRKYLYKPIVGTIYTVCRTHSPLFPDQFSVADYRFDNGLLGPVNFYKRDFIHLGESKELSKVEKAFYEVE